MKKVVSRNLLLFLIALGSQIGFFSASESLAREIQDATGEKVRVSDRPSRIVTLAPSLAETVADLIPSELSRLVGVSEYSDFPKSLRGIPSVGPYHQFNIEKIASLKPDLVLALSDGNPKDRVLQLKRLGLPVLTIEVERLRDIPNALRVISNALGSPQVGELKAKSFLKELEALEVWRSQSAQAPRVMVQVGESPRVVVGKKSFLSDLLERLGAVNIYSDSPNAYLIPSVEDVFKRRPDLILILVLDPTEKNTDRLKKAWERLNPLNQSHQIRVEVLRNDALVRPTYRVLHGIEALSQVIFKDRHWTQLKAM